MGRLIAPPYDVLSQADRAALLANDPHNIVTLDLPHFPPKEAGADEVYQRAAITLDAWLKAGVLARDGRPALYPYAQTYEYNGRSHRRRGFFALVRLTPFGQGPVVPHEKTHAGPIEDRLKLMRATGVQLSPIFGLFDDPGTHITDTLYHQLSRPELTVTLDDIRNDLWCVAQAELENYLIDQLASKSIYIADGHHRYTTALQYRAEAEAAHGGPLPPHHPANWCLFVLVGMQDPGLIILPTHRLIGGLSGFDLTAFHAAVAPGFEMTEAPFTAAQLPEFVNSYLPKRPPHTFGLFDGQSRKLMILRPRSADALRQLEPERSDAWRQLDVAILHRYLLEEVLGPVVAKDKPMSISYSADPAEILPRVDGQRYQLALLLQPTPLAALKELGKHGEVMPQKSTYFYPKLATGIVINSIR